MPQKPQNKIIKNPLIHYNQFISVRTKSLIWLQITIDTGKKHIVETEVKEKYQRLLCFIKIDII